MASGFSSTSRRTAAIYCRVSTPGQEEEGTSLQTQEERCRAYVEEHGYQLDEAHVYREVHSGAELDERPQLTALREVMARRDIDVVVTYAVDRLSRDQIQLAVIVYSADRAGVRLEFVTEVFEDSAVGKFIRSAKAFAGEVEREKIRERTMRGRKARVQSGKVQNAGFELYGYRRDRELGVRHVYEPEAAVVRQVYRWIGEEGVPIRSAIRWLNETGVPSPSIGKIRYSDPDKHPTWQNGSVHRIVKNPAYKGRPMAWRYKSLNHKGGVLVRPESEWIALPSETTPALVSPELWQAAQDRLATNKGESTRNATRPHLLRGMVFCSVCGRKMWGADYPSRGQRYYRCGSRAVTGAVCGGKTIRAGDVEEWAWGHVAGVLRDPSTITAELSRRQAQVIESGHDYELDAAKRALVKIEQQQERLVRRYRESDDDLFPWEVVEREIKRSEQEKAQLQARVLELTGRVEGQRAAIEHLDAVRVYVERVASRLTNPTFAQKRLAFEALGVRVAGSGKAWQLEGAIPTLSGPFHGSSSVSAMRAMLYPDTTTRWVVPDPTRARRRLSGMLEEDPTSKPASSAAWGSGRAR